MRFFVICLTLFVAACAGTNFKWEDTERINPGMTEAEVVQILGNPYLRTQSGNMKMLTWSYASAFGGAKAVSYRFVDGKVVGNTSVNR